jgi:hypothetical protein
MARRRKASPATVLGLPWPLPISHQDPEVRFAEQAMVVVVRNFPPADAIDDDEEDGDGDDG